MKHYVLTRPVLRVNDGNERPAREQREENRLDAVVSRRGCAGGVTHKEKYRTCRSSGFSVRAREQLKPEAKPSIIQHIEHTHERIDGHTTGQESCILYIVKAAGT